MNWHNKITSMEPLELAAFLCEPTFIADCSCNSNVCPYFEGDKCNAREYVRESGNACHDAALRWLLSEVEESSEENNKNDAEKTYDFYRIMGEAKDRVLESGAESESHFEDVFECAAEYWHKYLTDHCVEYGSDVCITPEDVSALMILFNLSRFITSDLPGRDPFIEIAKFSAICGEICERKRARVKDV